MTSLSVILQRLTELISIVQEGIDKHEQLNQKGEKQLRKIASKQRILCSDYKIDANGIQNFRYLVVLDFEATCEEPKTANFKPEIIEWPAMIIDTREKKILTEKFHFYIKPERNPKLSKFCTDLTGITQTMVDEGCSIQHVVSQWNEWCYIMGLLPESIDKPNACIVTCGDWDLRVMWTKQSKLDSSLGTPMLFHSWINIKHVFEWFYKQKSRGMMMMLEKMGIKHVGRHHSGIDDVRNISNIVLSLLNNGVLFQYTTKNVKGRSIQTDIDFKQKKNIQLIK